MMISLTNSLVSHLVVSRLESYKLACLYFTGKIQAGRRGKKQGL
jgi:hypothetical protein